MPLRIMIAVIALLSIVGQVSAAPLPATLPDGPELIQDARGNTDDDGQNETVCCIGGGKSPEPSADTG